jgi:hypothetical protein
VYGLVCCCLEAGLLAGWWSDADRGGCDATLAGRGGASGLQCAPQFHICCAYHLTGGMEMGLLAWGDDAWHVQLPWRHGGHGISLAQTWHCGSKGAGRVVECVRTLPGLLRSGWTVIVGFLQGLYSSKAGIYAAVSCSVCFEMLVVLFGVCPSMGCKWCVWPYQRKCMDRCLASNLCYSITVLAAAA